MGDRLARASSAGARHRDEDRLRLAAEGALLRRRAQPARAAAGHRRRGLGRPAHRRHAAEGAPGDAPHAAGHPDHDPGVAVPDDHLAGARDPHRGRGRDRRRDPRRRAVQARRAPRADARAPLAAGRRTRATRIRSGSASRRPSARSSGSRSSWSAPSASARSSTPGVRKDLDLADRRPGRGHDGTGPARLDRLDARRRTDERGPGHAATSRRTASTPARSRPSLDPAANPRSIWPAIYPELLKLVREHTSTIIFVNNRRGAERLAKRLNELHNEEPHEELPATEHDGTGTAQPERRAETSDEPLRGDRPRPPRLARPRGAPHRRGDAQVGQAAVPGRDLLARARDRHGRARPGDPGRVAEVGLPRPAAGRARRPPAQRGLEGPHLPEVPRRPARVRRGRQADARGRDRGDGDPAQPARRARPAPGLDGRRRASGRSTRSSAWSPRPSRSPSSRASSSRTCSTCSTGAIRRRSSPSCGPRVVWDRTAGTVRGRKGARQLAVTNAGTIPDRGLYGVHLPDGRRVGELDEEMVYEARPGQTFLLGATTWRIQDITRDRVIVIPAPGVPGAVPFWRGDGVGRPPELGRAIGAFAREAVGKDAEELAAEYDLDPPRRREPRHLPARAAGRDAGRALRRDAGRREVPRRDRRLAAVRAVAVRRPRPRRLGPGALGADPRRARPRGRRDLVRRRDRRPPARRRRAARRRPGDARARRDRGPGRPRARRLGPVRRALSRERRPQPADPARLPGQAHAAVAAAAEVAEPARGREGLPPLPGDPRDLPRVPARRARPAGADRAAARPALAQDHAWSRSRRRPRRRSPPRCCSTTSPPTCTRATRPTPSAGRPRSRSTATCSPSCSARTSCAS